MQTGHLSSEVRDLQSLNDKLRKEMERKESKLQSLTKELQATRASQHDHHKELRFVSGSLELLQSEKEKIQTDNTKLRKQVEELRKKHVHLSDATKLAAQLEQLKQDKEQLSQQLTCSQAELTLRDTQIKTLQYEVDVAHRALLVQNKYEGTTINSTAAATLPGSLGSNRELLRSLYFDLGKSAADNHALSLSMASSEQAQQALEGSLQSCQEERNALKVRVDELEVTLHARDNSIRDQNVLISCLQEQVHDLDSQLTNKTKAMQIVQADRDDTAERHNVLEREFARLTHRLRQSEADHAQLLAQHEATQSDLKNVRDEVQREKDVLLEEISRLRHVEQSFLSLQQNHRQLQTDHESMGRKYDEMQQHYLELKANVHLHVHQQQALTELVTSRERMIRDSKDEQGQLLAERDTLATALTKSMALVRQMQERCEEDREARLVAEKELQESMRIKEEMTQAVVKALHDERQKAHDLSSALQMLRQQNVSPYKVAGASMGSAGHRPRQNSSSGEPTPGNEPYQWIRRDAQIDQQVQRVYQSQPLPLPQQQQQFLQQQQSQQSQQQSMGIMSVSVPSYDVTHAMSNPHFAAALQRVAAGPTPHGQQGQSASYHAPTASATPPVHMSLQQQQHQQMQPQNEAQLSNNTIQVTVEQRTPQPQQQLQSSPPLPTNTSVVFRDSILYDLNRLNEEIRSILPTPQSQSQASSSSSSSKATNQSLMSTSLLAAQPPLPPVPTNAFYPAPGTAAAAVATSSSSSRQPLQAQDLTNNTTFYSLHPNNSSASTMYNNDPRHQMDVSASSEWNHSSSVSRYPNIPPEWEALAQTLRVSTPVATTTTTSIQDASAESKYQ
jgi:predicted  nucleic acid-binding Zn-ribbon protein